MNVKFTPPKDPARDRGIQLPYASGKRVFPHWRWYVILLIVTSPLLWMLFHLMYSKVFVTAPGFLSLDKVAINAPQAALLEQVKVEAGDRVAAGQIIAQLQDHRLAERREAIRAELDSLERRPVESAPEDLESLYRQQLRLAEKNVIFHRDRLNKITFLFEQGAATAAEVSALTEQLRSAEHLENQAKIDLADYRSVRMGRVTQGSAPEDARRKVLIAELASVQAQIEGLQVKASYGGRILDVLAVAGENLAGGTPIVLMGRLDQPAVIAYLDPENSLYTRKDQNATVSLPGGETCAASVVEDANLTRRLPADLSSSIGTRDIMTVVKLRLLQSLPDDQIIDGLPVSVRFHFR
jgi:multidrug resistance efflux pump